MSVTVPSPGDAGSIYAIPIEDWKAMCGRAKVVVDDEALANVIARYIPNYLALLAASKTWQATTFPGLISQTAYVAIFANGLADQLSSFSDDLVGLKPTDPVPSSVSFILRVQLGASAESAGKIEAELDGLAPDITSFVEQNRIADQALTGSAIQLPPDWSSLAGDIDTLERGLNEVQTSWGTISAELASLSSQSDRVSTGELLALDLTGTIAAWRKLASDAGEFESNVSGLVNI